MHIYALFQQPSQNSCTLLIFPSTEESYNLKIGIIYSMLLENQRIGKIVAILRFKDFTLSDSTILLIL